MPITNKVGAFIALLGGLAVISAQPSITLPVKYRDFKEVMNGRLANDPTAHPDFNNDDHLDCGINPPNPGGWGYAHPAIDSTGPADPQFPMDNRNPTLARTNHPTNGRACYTSTSRFTEWFADKQGVNRPFRSSIRLDSIGSNLYRFSNTSFFPLDNGIAPPTSAAVFPAPDNVTYGHRNGPNNGGHNFGFTMEFHSTFTYQQEANQVFTFQGDDDVWVFINGRMVIDLGGLHSAISRTITLNANLRDVTGALMNLVDGESYTLDFFFAERHTTASNCIITTSLKLAPPKVETPVANPPGRSFPFDLFVTVSTGTPGATIHYTTDGTTPTDKSPTYTGAIPLTQTTTLKAIAVRQGWINSDVMTEQYTKPATTTTLDILDQNGNPLTGGYLTELNTGYTVRINTSEAGINTLNPTATTKVATDVETLTLTGGVRTGDRIVFSGLVPFAIAAKAANGRTEASTYDSLTVTWAVAGVTKATKTIAVRPAPKQATAFFSTKPDGSDNTTAFAGTETTIYVVVVDQLLPAGTTPKVTLVTKPFVTGSSADNETLNLVAIPGKSGQYIATVPVDLAGATTAGNGRLRLANADQITATYTDPIDGDVAVANAGFGAPAVIDAVLEFVTAAGDPVATGAYYSPSEGRLYVRYTDDYADGSKATKTVTLSIKNNNGTATTDEESFEIPMVPAKRVETRAVWEGSIALKDLLAITKANDTAETYVLGEVTASVTSHNGTGGVGDVVSDLLLVAYPDITAKISIVDAKDSTAKIGRVTDGLVVKLTEQSLSSGIDTVSVTLRCNSDLVNVKLVEVSPGVYVSQTIPKAEGAGANDGTLQCQSTDNIRVSYVDPVYKTTADQVVTISEPVTSTITYTTATPPETPITSILESEARTFKVVIDASGRSTTAPDSFQIVFTTPQKEQAVFIARETGAHTQKFVVEVPIAFVTGNIDATNKILEGKITATETNNQVVATGTMVDLDGNEVKKNITLIAAYVPVVKAWIKDTDADGRGDKVYVQFEGKLGRLPDSLSAQWNTQESAFNKALKPKISFVGGDSSLIVADYSGAPFGAGLTHIPEGTIPVVRLPAEDGLFAGQTKPLEDSIGPVIVKAVKHPAVATPGNEGFNLDTLRITLTEPIKSGTDLKDMIKYSLSCDYDKTISVVATSEPRLDGSDPTNPYTYVIVVNTSTGAMPSVGNCVFLNSDPGRVTDLKGNLPPEKGFKLQGNDRPKLIELVRGFPPVSGLDTDKPIYQIAVQDPRTEEKGWITPNSGGKLKWVAPVGYYEAANSGKEFQSFLPGRLSDPPTGETDPSRIVDFPSSGISAIQVVTRARYVATVSIFDNFGNFVKSFKQSFGYRGEMDNQDRVVRNGFADFLVWNQKDHKGQQAGQGVYVWKVVFTFDNGKQEIQYTRTGIMRR